MLKLEKFKQRGYMLLSIGLIVFLGAISQWSAWKTKIPVIIFLLAVGCIMDIFSAIVIIVPIIVPIAMQYGIDPIHLGVIFLVNLEIGYSTPPVGINLFIASLTFKQPVTRLYRASLPYLALLLLALAVITYLPDLSLWLVNK